MNEYDVNEILITEIKKRVPKGANIAAILTDTIHISSVAAYRRLRNEVPFTLQESVIIADKFGFSLDILKAGHHGQTDSHAKGDDSAKKMSVILTDFVNVFERFRKDLNARFYLVSRTVPILFLYRYPALFRFRMFKWAHQTRRPEETSKIQTMSDGIIPGYLTSAAEKYVQKSQKIKTQYYILDMNLFEIMLKEIRYFRKLSLVSAEDIITMKKELHSLLDEMETVALTGRFGEVENTFIYLSHLDIDAAYFYIEDKDSEEVSSVIYSMVYNTFLTEPDVSHFHKNWILSTMRYATLISHSGEMQRREFFVKQHNLVNEL